MSLTINVATVYLKENRFCRQEILSLACSIVIDNGYFRQRRAICMGAPSFSRMKEGGGGRGRGRGINYRGGGGGGGWVGRH